MRKDYERLRGQRVAVVGGGAGQREGGLDDVEARHLLGFRGRVGATGGGVGAGVFDGGVMRAEEVAVEAQHAAGLGVVGERAGAEDGVGAVLRDRRVLDEAGLRDGDQYEENGDDRHRGKIEATINNAGRALDLIESGTTLQEHF